MSACELVQVCTAAAKVGFYDPGLMSEVTSALRRALSRRSTGGLQPGEIVAALKSLAELNAYDKELFAAAIRVLRGSVDCLEPARRQELLEALKAAKHREDEEFIDDLARKSKAERYEAAKDELMKRSLQRMYGETQDLQGWAVDTERALLKRPRAQVTRERG